MFDVAVHAARVLTVPRLLPLPGNVVASREILVTAKISGYLRRIPVEEGHEVDADQVLVEIDPSLVDSAVVQSEASLRAAQAAVGDAQRDLVRQRQLRDKGMVSEAALNKAALRVDQAQADLDRTRSQLQASRSERAYARIISPVRARVVQRLRQPGDLATPGQPVLRLQALDGNQFETHVPASQASALRIGQHLSVRLDGREQALEGTVTHLVAAPDPVTRTIKMKVALPLVDGIVPGLFGRALLPQGDEVLIAIPAGALVERLGIEGVFVVDAKGIVRFVSVYPGRSFEGQREVLAGLTEDERVVAAPPTGMRDGDRVAHGIP